MVTNEAARNLSLALVSRQESIGEIAGGMDRKVPEVKFEAREGSETATPLQPVLRRVICCSVVYAGEYQQATEWRELCGLPLNSRTARCPVFDVPAVTSLHHRSYWAKITRKRHEFKSLESSLLISVVSTADAKVFLRFFADTT